MSRRRSSDPRQLTLDFDLMLPKWSRVRPLKENNVRTTLDSKGKTDEELLAIKGVGRKTVRSVRKIE